MFVRLASLLIILAAAPLLIQAQETKDRQLVWAYDFSTVQMPVEIVSIKLDGKDIVPGEKIPGNDNWLRGIAFTLKNISGQPISFINICFKFSLPNSFLFNCALSYGVNSSHGEIRREPSPPAIKPDQTLELVFTKERYDSFLYVMAQAKAPSNFETASFLIERVCFENQPDVIWQGGYLKRRHAVELGRYDVIQKYFLPAKQE